MITLLGQQKLMQKFFELNMLAQFLGPQGGMTISRGHGGHSVFHGQGRLLLVLAENDNISQKELATRLGMTPQSTAESISKLVKKGLVIKRKSPDDGRIYLIKLTNDGRDEVKKMTEIEPAGLKHLTDDEKDQLLVLMTKLVDGMQADFEEKTPNAGVISSVQRKIAEHIISEHIPKKNK